MDRAAELCGALALAVGGAVSAWIATPMLVEARQPVALAAGAAGALIGWLFVRHSGETQLLALPTFDILAVDTEGGDLTEGDILLLDQPVAAAVVPSRVISLFGADEVPTAGELRRQIEAHLSQSAPPVPGSAPQAVPDAREDLHEALANLRRSLRRS